LVIFRDLTVKIRFDAFEAEQALVSANRELAQRMEERIAAAIGRVWGGV